MAFIKRFAIYLPLLIVLNSCSSYQMVSNSPNITTSYTNGKPYYLSSMGGSEVSFSGSSQTLTLGIRNTSGKTINFDPRSIYVQNSQGKHSWAMPREKYLSRLKTAMALNSFSAGLSSSTYHSYGGNNNFNSMVQNQISLNRSISSFDFASKNYLGITTLSDENEHLGFVSISLGKSTSLNWLFVTVGNDIHKIPFFMTK